jgi:hypothetical protein
MPAAVSAMAGAETTVAAPAEPDPIFAAIENNRKVDAEFIRLCDAEDALEESGIELLPGPDGHRTAEMAAVCDTSIKSRKSLARTAPTTLAGLAAYIDYPRHWSADDEFLFDGNEESADFLESLHRALCGLNAGDVS